MITQMGHNKWNHVKSVKSDIADWHHAAELIAIVWKMKMAWPWSSQGIAVGVVKMSLISFPCGGMESVAKKRNKGT
jgi:hypothetical protein